jgi:hypothetical protein
MRRGVPVLSRLAARALYSFGPRLLPPRGTTYMKTIKATITTAAIATMATVDAATITRDSFPTALARKPSALYTVGERGSRRRWNYKATT